MNNSIDISKIGVGFSRFFKRFHATIYFAIIGVSLGISVLIVLQILGLSNAANDTSVQPISTSFDKKTIEKVDSLGTTNNDAKANSGRINPFSE